MFSGSIVSPAAAACPPKPSRLFLAASQGVVEIDATGSPAGSDGRSISQWINGNQDRRPVIGLGNSTGHDSNHAQVPIGLGQDQRRFIFRMIFLFDQLVGSAQDFAIQRITILVQLIDILRQRFCPLC